MRHTNADAASEARDVRKGGPPRRRPIGSTDAAVLCCLHDRGQLAARCVLTTLAGEDGHAAPQKGLFRAALSH